MNPDIRRRYPVIVNALKDGAEPQDIPGLVGISPRIWANIQVDPVFKQMVEGEQEPEDRAMTSEEVLEQASKMTRQAFEALETVVNDTTASPTARIASAKEIMAWREELQRKKSEAEARVVYHLHVDRKAVENMQAMVQMFMTDEGRAWMDDMLRIMPNSTV